MRKILSVILIISFILAGSVLAFGQKNFFELVKTGTLEEVNNAIKAGANVNARDEDGKTPLMYAARDNQNPDVIKVLLEAGADVNASDEFGGTPLMYAARDNQNPDVIKVLLKAGADVNARDKYGKTPLMHAAAWNENPEIIKILIEAGADGKAKDNEGKTAFDYAEENEHIKGTEAYWLLSDAQY